MNLKHSALTALAALALAACSANSGNDLNHGTGANAGSGGSNNGGSPSGGGGSGGSQDMDAMIPVDGSSGGMKPSPDGGTCSAQSVAAEPYPLDMYVMMDQSGSMTNPLGFGVPPKTQWTAAVEAFTNFLNGNQEKGLGMGIQYFPLKVVGWDTLAACDKDNPCPNDGACLNFDGGKCYPKCTSDAQCPSGAECMPTDSGSFCSNTSCVATDYEKPDVEIDDLPKNNAKLIASLKAHDPTTMTPTVPALQGAIDHASTWAKKPENADHKVIVVLVTDGMPSVCDADSNANQLVQQVKQIAQTGVNKSPSIKTFVIGVVNPMDIISKGNLDQMASAGGTGNAFIIDPNANMTTALVQALQLIRGAAMKCEFKIPSDPMLAYDKVNVIYHGKDNKDYPQFYVGDISKCDPVKGGWYYDTDPEQKDPSKIILCPQTCDFAQKAGGKINIEIGCETLVPPK